jgi:actin-related protein 8
MRFSSFPIVHNINQKNYYTDYLKKDDQASPPPPSSSPCLANTYPQIYTNRLVAAEIKEAEAREAAAKLAQETETPASEDETEPSGSKVIVLHIGSRNLRIGLASHTFPHTIPMLIARPAHTQFPALPPRPERATDDPDDDRQEPLFPPPFEDGIAKLDVIFKMRLKAAKKRTVPNARELVASFNRRSQSEEVLDFNDPEQIEWIQIDPTTSPRYYIGREVTPLPRPRPNSRHYASPMK